MNEAFYSKIAKTRLRSLQDTGVPHPAKLKAEVLQFQLRDIQHDACRAQARGALSNEEKSKRTNLVGLVLLLCTIMADASERKTKDAIKLLLLSEQNNEAVQKIKGEKLMEPICKGCGTENEKHFDDYTASYCVSCEETNEEIRNEEAAAEHCD